MTTIPLTVTTRTTKRPSRENRTIHRCQQDDEYEDRGAMTNNDADDLDNEDNRDDEDCQQGDEDKGLMEDGGPEGRERPGDLAVGMAQPTTRFALWGPDKAAFFPFWNMGTYLPCTTKTQYLCCVLYSMHC